MGQWDGEVSKLTADTDKLVARQAARETARTPGRLWRSRLFAESRFGS